MYDNHRLYVIEGSLYFVDLATNDFQEVSELADEIEDATELSAIHAILLQIMGDTHKYPQLKLVVVEPTYTRPPESTDIPF